MSRFVVCASIVGLMFSLIGGGTPGIIFAIANTFTLFCGVGMAIVEACDEDYEY